MVDNSNKSMSCQINTDQFAANKSDNQGLYVAVVRVDDMVDNSDELMSCHINTDWHTLNLLFSVGSQSSWTHYCPKL
jgi:hypothetical protein